VFEQSILLVGVNSLAGVDSTSFVWPGSAARSQRYHPLISADVERTVCSLSGPRGFSS